MKPESKYIGLEEAIQQIIIRKGKTRRQAIALLEDGIRDGTLPAFTSDEAGKLEEIAPREFRLTGRSK